MSNPVPKKRPESLEVTRFRTACAAHGWRNWVEVSDRADVQPGTISSAVGCDFVGFEKLKLKLECAFQFKEAIWSDPEQLRLRKKVFDATGKDVMQITLPELHVMAKRFGVTPGKKTNNTQLWRDAILRFAAVNTL